MYVFFDKHGKYLEKYNEIQKKINSEPVHNKNYIKVERKSMQKKVFLCNFD